MRRRLLLALALLAPAAQAGELLEFPPPVRLDNCADAAEGGSVARTALEEEGWQVRADSGNAITADLSNRMHALRIRVEYTEHEVAFRYVDSQRLGYEQHKGEHFIDAKVNDWLRDLADEVAAEAARSCTGHTIEVVPVESAPEP